MKTSTSKKKPKSARILWAVDPFHSEKEVLKSAAWCLRALVKVSPSEIEPVYVWPTMNTDNVGLMEPGFLEKVASEGNDLLGNAIARVKVPGLLPLKVIASPLHSVRSAARGIVKYANESEADLLVVSTHGRKGLQRVMLGSFAETISLYANIPLVSVHPNWSRTPDFKKILFATDFSEESQSAFSKLLDFAERQKSKVTLFHKVVAPIPPTPDFGFPNYDIYEKAFDADLESALRCAKALTHVAKSRGVRLEVIIDKGRGASASTAILKLAKKGGFVVAMAAQSGPVSSVLIGSTARQVIRCSEQPVWIIHPHPQNQAAFCPLYGAAEDAVVERRQEMVAFN